MSTPANPLKRVRSALSMSQSQFASALDHPLSKTTILNYEDGLYLEIPRPFYDDIFALAVRSDIADDGVMVPSYSMFNREYETSRINQRIRSGYIFRRVTTSTLGSNRHEHPHCAFRRLAVGPDVRLFGRLLCVKSDLVLYFEGRAGNVMPRELVEAYSDAGVATGHLERAIANWRGRPVGVGDGRD